MLWLSYCHIHCVKAWLVVKLILISILVTLFVNCSSNNDSQVVRLPELVNPNTGLREIRLRRYDCDSTTDQASPLSCAKNEELISQPRPQTTAASKPKVDPSGPSSETISNETPKSVKSASELSTNIRVNELTPWLNTKSRTVVNPTVMHNDLKEKFYLTAYLREFSTDDQQFKDYKYEFVGDLKTYKKNWLATKERRYLNLKIATSESKQIVNAIVHCFDIPRCKEITVIVSFANIDTSGNSFIDSRAFQIDQREARITPENAVPNKTKVSIQEPVYLEDIETSEELSESDNDDSEIVSHEQDITLDEGDSPEDIKTRRPLLRPDHIDQLCEGLMGDSKSPCPKYLVDPTVEKPNPLLALSNLRPKPRPDHLTKIDSPLVVADSVDIVDEKVFPLEEVILEPYTPRESEPDIDLLPKVDSKTYKKLDYLEFLLKKQLEASTAKSSPNIDVEPEFEEFDMVEQDKTEKVEIDYSEPINQDSPEETGLAKSKRPTKRPENLMAKFIENQNVALVPFESIDGKFTYDISLCGEHLIKAKNLNYYQARGDYSSGSIVKASHYTDSPYQTIDHAPRPNRQYGSEISKQVLEFAGCVLEQRYGQTLENQIGSISFERGGRLTFISRPGSHKSHQNGLDIDVSYPHINKKTRGFDNFANNLEESRVIAAFDQARLMIYTDRVTMLFTDNRIRTKFCRYLKANDKLSGHRNVVEMFMRQWPGHFNHYHVRVKCTLQNEGCVYEEYPKSSYCDGK